MGSTNFSGPVYAMGVPLPVVGGIPTLGGKYRLVDASPSDELRLNELWYPTIAAALTAAQSGDVILIAPGSYDEALTITASNITLVGCGNAGAVAVVPSTTDATAIKVQGTATRTQDVTFINVGAETNGTGIGVHLLGNLRRIRFYGGKIEGGTDSLKIESDATGSVADTSFRECEFCWSTNGVHITASGGGDPVTQTRFERCFFHNHVTDVVKTSTSHTADLWIINSVFNAQEDGTEPTQYLDIDEASTTGYIAGNFFATTVFDTASFAIAAGVLFTNNISQAENPSANVGGTSGRPD